jgi:hypothetical protein
VLELDKVIRAVSGSLVVDTNDVPLSDLLYALHGITPGRLAGVEVPSEPQMIGGISYITPLTEAETLYEAIRDDTLDAWGASHPDWTNAI